MTKKTSMNASWKKNTDIKSLGGAWGKVPVTLVYEDGRIEVVHPDLTIERFASKEEAFKRMNELVICNECGEANET